MSMLLFTRAILEGKPIKLYNEGKLKRDYTYIDDIVEGILRVMDHKAEPDSSWDGEHPDPSSSSAPYRIYNIGNNTPIRLTRYIEILEECLGVEAKKELLPLQPGDVIASWADVGDIARDMGYHPATPVEVGVPRFVEWYREFYG